MNSKKRILIFGAMILILVALFIGVIVKFADINSENSVLTEDKDPAQDINSEPTVLTELDKDHNPNEKKVIFIGNSYTYYGNMVQTFTWDVSNKEKLLNRFTHEKGGFYQLCKQNGANFSVTNWTFGSHTLQDLFGGGCFDKNRHPGYDHLADLRKYSDLNYDYVVIQAPTGGAITNMEDYDCLLGYVCNIFRKVNPDVEIICSIPTLLYTQQDERSAEIIGAIDGIIKKYDLIKANWGKLIADILSGEVTVENSFHEYTNNTFLVSKSADDGFHPNLLTG